MRSANVNVSPNSWAVSVGEGVDEGEEYEDSAKRGLGEELGLPVLELHEIDKVYTETRKDSHPDSPIIKSWSKIFAVEYDGSDISFEEDEVSKVEWFSVDEIDQMLQKDKDSFSMRFPAIWKKVRDNLKQFVGG